MRLIIESDHEEDFVELVLSDNDLNNIKESTGVWLPERPMLTNGRLLSIYIRRELESLLNTESPDV